LYHCACMVLVHHCRLGANSFIAFNDQAAMQGARGAFDLLINCASARVSAADLLALLRKDGTLVQVSCYPGAIPYRKARKEAVHMPLILDGANEHQ
jgi:D-arabinose 1-dehydrogenase-like Zn-dependent alcohol dehydrogenase